MSLMHARVCRSLAVIVIVVFGGYVIDALNGMIVVAHLISPDTDDLIRWYWINWSLLPIGIAAASCGPILYFTRLAHFRTWDIKTAIKK